MQAWMRRAKDLEIITQGHYETLCRRISAQGWRREEPIAFEGQERASRLTQLMLRALAEGIITPSRAREILPKVQEKSLAHATPVRKLFPTEMMKLPREERRRHLAQSAGAVAKHYAHGAA